MRGHDLIPMPGPFGHEFSGTIHSIGEDVTKFDVGYEIMSVHSAPCQNCDYCGRGLHNLCRNIMKDKVLGAFSEYLLIPEHVIKQNAYTKPKNISFDEAAMLEPLACVVHPYGSFDIKDVRNALVIGAGPIGLLHLLYLKRKGINTIVSDINEERLEVARTLRANHSALPDPLAKTVNETTNGMGVDLVVECTGQPEVWQECVNYIRRGGTVILFGGCKGGTSVQFDTRRLHYDEITLIGSFHFTPGDVKSAYDMLCTVDIDVKPLITDTAKLKDIRAVFEDLRNGKGIKYSIRP
jgi:L-iditol 2-dehydrogenase